MSTLPPETVRRIEDAATALIAVGTPNPTNDQVRAHLGGGSLSHISPVMRAFRARQREQRAEQAPALPPELAREAHGPQSDPRNPLLRDVGWNYLKGRLRSHPDVAERYYRDVLRESHELIA